MFQQNLKKLREKFGFTQDQLAEKLEMTRQTYSKLESGTKEIGIKSLQQIAKIFNVTTDALLGTDIDAQFITNKKPKELRDYIYIDQRKVSSYLGALGYSDIVKISNQITSGHQNDFEANGNLPTIAKVGVSINKSKQRVQTWEEIKNQENIANKLIDEMEENEYISDTVSQGKIIKFTSKIKTINTVEMFKKMFEWIPMIEQFQGKALFPKEQAGLFKMIEGDLVAESSKLIINAKENKNFYSKLNKDYLLNIENPQDIDDIYCTIIGKIRKVTKSDEPIIDFNSLSILPSESKIEFYKSFAEIPKKLNPNSDNTPIYYEEGSYILEVIAIYQ